MSKNFTIRLYWQYDLDLIALAKHPDFQFSKWIKEAIVAWAKGDADFYIPLPERKFPFSTELTNTTLHCNFSDNDIEAIQCLNNIRTGFRNSAVKLIFRMYLREPYMAPYFNDETFKVKCRGKAVPPVQISNSMQSEQQKPRRKPIETPPINRVETSEPAPVPTPVQVSAPPVSQPQPTLVQAAPVQSVPVQPVATQTVTVQAPVQNDAPEDDFDLFGAIGGMI